MIIKLFFLAAASAMFMVCQTFQKQASPRMPANSRTLIYAVDQTQSGYIPWNMNVTQQAFTYNDVNNVYQSAIANESTMQQNYLTLQGMLAQAKAQPNNQGTVYDQASPYNTRNKTIRDIEFELTRLKALRTNSLDTAYMRLWFTYASIQNAPTDGRKGLTKEQHEDAKKKMEHLLVLKQAVQLADSGYFPYTLQTTPYLTAGLYTPPIVIAPQPVEQPVAPAPAITDGGDQNSMIVNEPAPVETINYNDSNLVEPVLQ